MALSSIIASHNTVYSLLDVKLMFNAPCKGRGDRTTPRTTSNTPLSTLSPIPSTLTPSPEYQKCILNCPTTGEYNPVCGTNSQTYSNVGKLNCAGKCGIGT